MIEIDFPLFYDIMASEFLLGLSLVCLLIGLFYYFSFLKLTFHKNVKMANDEYEPVSVVLVIVDEIEYLQNSFEILLKQDYPNDYQVIIVNDRPETVETIDYLNTLKERFRDKLYVTTIKRDSIFNNAKRLAYTIGIKAAKYNNIIFTDPTVEIKSNHWLKSMSRGFYNKSVVFGYSEIKFKKGIKNKIFRAINTFDSLMWLSAAKNNNIFRATILNLGFTSELFFKIGGYRERLRLNTGESDLFVQKLVNSNNKAEIVLSRTATTAKNLDDYNIKRWYKNQIFDFYTTRFYKLKDFLYLTFAPLFSFLFWLSAASVIIFDYTLWYYILAMVVLRWFIMCFTLFRFSKLTGSKIPYFMCFIYDIFGTFYKILLFLSRKFNPSFDLWVRIIK
ncbi:MAG: glycosyltransferase [Rikenellaceae bacterium]